jgi:steroid delta-isomerase-like uncharacterized protein
VTATALLEVMVELGAEPVGAKTCMEGKREHNRQLVRRLYEECINPNQLELLSRFVADGYVGPQGDRGPSAYAATLTSLRQGFPDVRFSVEDLVAEGDRVAVRWTWLGTHAGTFNGIPASARSVRNEGIAIYQLEAGKITRSWLQVDRLGVLQQIGFLPSDVTSLATSSKSATSRAMREARHLSVLIDRPANEVYDFVSKLENFPQWATGLGASFRKIKGEWIADSPAGKVKIRMARKNRLGVLDHDVVLATGETIANPMRVVPRGAGSEVSFTLFRRPEMTDEMFSQDAQWVEKDLNILKGLLEKPGGRP